MYELIEAYRQENNLGNDLKERAVTLCKCLAFDRYQIIIFNKDKLYGYILDPADYKKVLPPDDREKIIFDRAENSSYLNLLLDEKKVVLHQHKHKEDSERRYKPLTGNARAELYLPLFSSGYAEDEIEVIGCFYLAKKDQLDGDINKLLADKNIVLQFTAIQRIVESIYNHHISNRKFLDLVHIFFEIIKAKDHYTNRHCYNVAYLSNLLGRAIGFSVGQLRRLYMAAVLHDIGKVYVPESILIREGVLTEAEMREMERHSLYGYQIIRDLTPRFKILAGLDRIILYHHERYDGTGYPDGLTGKEIPLKSRILAIADAVDAMLTERSYKKPKDIGGAIRDLANNRGKQFDPYLAKKMIKILVNKRIDYEDALAGPITTGAMEILTREGSCQLQGTLMKTNLGYEFKQSPGECLCEKCKSPLAEITQASFHTEGNGRICEYSAKIFYKSREKIYISRLTPNPQYSYFSLPWELSGILIFKKGSSAEIVINKIGGDMLSFFAGEGEFSNVDNLDDVDKVTVHFEDKKITVTGKITKTIKVNQKLHCVFKYLNIPESMRDEIFKQIFKKQTEFSSSLLAHC